MSKYEWRESQNGSGTFCSVKGGDGKSIFCKVIPSSGGTFRSNIVSCSVTVVDGRGRPGATETLLSGSHDTHEMAIIACEKRLSALQAGGQ